MLWICEANQSQIEEVRNIWRVEARESRWAVLRGAFLSCLLSGKVEEG